MPSRTEHIKGLANAIGRLPAFNILARRALNASKPVEVRSGDLAFSIRPTDSDLFVASQIFGQRDYDLGPLNERLRAVAKSWLAEGVTPVIVDGGANVGYSALYFAETFPEAVVIAVEADATTFEQLQRNCRKEDRIIPVHAAMWSHERGVDLQQGGELGSWANRVGGDAGLTPSMLLSSVLARVQGGRPLIIKLDIEGAEREVCGAASAELASAPCILIEPHDFMLPGAGCLTTLFQTLSGRSVDTLLMGENLVFIDTAVTRR